MSAVIVSFFIFLQLSALQLSGSEEVLPFVCDACFPWYVVLLCTSGFSGFLHFTVIPGMKGAAMSAHGQLSNTQPCQVL